MPQGLTDYYLTLVKAMARCRQATSHYLNQCRSNSLTPYGFTRSLSVKSLETYPTGELRFAMTDQQKYIFVCRHFDPCNHLYSFVDVIAAMLPWFSHARSLSLLTTTALRWRHNEHDGVKNRLFAQTFIQVQIKGNIKASRHWPLCGEFTGDRWIPRTFGQ